MLYRRFKKFVEEKKLLASGEKVLAAVSGGSDSVAMLQLLAGLKEEWGLDIEVACIDHGIRPEARREAEFVESLAGQWGLPFHLMKGDAAGRARREKKSLQHAAREMRYELLEKLMANRVAGKLAVGHTLDDQAETVIMNVIRGCGLDGLAGISSVRGAIIRPVLIFRRSELMEHLRRHAISYFSDKSNLDSRFMRTRIRHKIIPLLQEENPMAAVLLSNMAEEAGEVSRLLEAEAESFLEKHSHLSGEEWRVERRAFTALSSAAQSQVVRRMLWRLSSTLLGYYRRHVHDVVRLARKCRGTNILVLPDSVVVRREYDNLVFVRGWPGPGHDLSRERIAVEKGGTYVHRGLGVRVTVKVAGEEAVFPLELRRRRPGDRLLGRKKSLKKLMIDEKVPRFARDYVPLLARGGEIVWVAGFFALKNLFLRITMEPLGEPTPYLAWLEEQDRFPPHL